jgi:hypothetical protein
VYVDKNQGNTLIMLGSEGASPSKAISYGAGGRDVETFGNPNTRASDEQTSAMLSRTISSDKSV